MQTQFGEVPTPKRVDVVHDKEGNITGIHLYESWSGKDDNPTTILTKQGEYFVTNGEDPEYYTYNEKTNQLKNHTQAIKDEAEAKAQKEAAAATQNEILENLKKAAEEEIKPQEPKFGLGEDVQQPVTKGPDFKEVFAKNKTVNIDETGSNQRLTKNNQWNTNLVVPKKATFNEEGVPDRIAIELPSDYGSKNADGVAQKRYQVLYYNAETGRYADRMGVREFEMNITDDGIKLKQINPDDKKVKTFLDNNTKVVAKNAEKVLTDDGAKIDKKVIKDDASAQEILNNLANRNTAWQTYLTVGTDNGYLTGSNGLLEKLTDHSQFKTLEQIQPAIDGLMAAIPDNDDIKASPEYKAVETALAELNASGTLKDGKITQLDNAFRELAKTHMQSSQGVNYAHNSFIVGGYGKVVIQPNKSDSMWMTDAKITIGEQEYTFEYGGRTVDFQDLVENLNDNKRENLAFISNDPLANNRHGEIKFNIEKAEVAKKDIRFKSDGNEYPVKVEADANGVKTAFVYSPDGKTKVPVEDVLNGRKPMPQNVA